MVHISLNPKRSEIILSSGISAVTLRWTVTLWYVFHVSDFNIHCWYLLWLKWTHFHMSAQNFYWIRYIWYSVQVDACSRA